MLHALRRDRAIAIAIPAMNEEAWLPACLAALDRAAARVAAPVTLYVFANGCTDGTVALLERTRLRHARLRWAAASLRPGARHAGWARRLALDAAADLLQAPGDVLASTDADTIVAEDWLLRTLAHFEAGCDAVAGRAFTRRAERAALGAQAAHRLTMLGRYGTALDWLRADRAPDPRDPWPRHFYEGGASMALHLAMYRRIGGAPTPPVAEDRALFAAVRRQGGRIRHPLDVRVFTSSRPVGRARHGMADTVARWISQPAYAPLHETYGFPLALEPDRARPGDRLSFRTLPAAIAAAGAMIRARRSATAPQVEPIPLPPLLAEHGDARPEPAVEGGDCLVA
ncbi:glycosyltransferase [Sphingomonas morindae]|uniref:Glycosyltransferase n=1 Tax=Sphingomonas morindae TaxID=1541170 RepID=A0ABY4XDH2_9SPHN|nr:glycosyltransferase [Sphingomonas morindae]USI74894.1 glycosyltransferase [Sphingomonas morindae]